MGSAGDRETFVVLPGANDNAGGRFEYLMCSYAALKFIQDPVIKHIKLSNNSKDFGKFDDVVIENVLQNGSTENWQMQMKHSATGKMLAWDTLAADNDNNFSLNMYFKDYQTRKHSPSTKFVLFTNRTLPETVSFQLRGKPYRVTPFKSTVTCPLNTSEDCSVYQFEVTPGQAGDANEVKCYRDFFQCFYFCANQKNADQLEQEVTRLFTAAYGPIGDDKYKKFFENWATRKAIGGRKEKLYKEDIEMELARIVLEPYVKPIESKAGCVKANVLKRIISKFDITVIDNAIDCEKLIEYLWASCDRLHWNVDIPMMVAVNEANKDSVYDAVNVLNDSHKFILLGDCVDSNKLANRKIFVDLSDLEPVDYRSVAENFSCVIQGRECTSLGEILKSKDELKSLFKVGHLLKMIEKVFVIGDETVVLPEPYINRSIPKHLFSWSLIRDLADTVILLITYSDKIELLTMVEAYQISKRRVIDVTDCDFITPNDRDIVIPKMFVTKNKISLGEFKKICSETKRSVLYFELCKGDLNLLCAHEGNFSQLMKFRCTATDKTICESEILSNFMCETNVLLADPGMGKTVCSEFIKRTCPFDTWPIKINLREKLHLFQHLMSIEDLLAEILYCGESALVKSFQDCYSQQILLIWDGLDEVGTENVDLVISKIKNISCCSGYRQWITSRYHLKEKLETAFDALSITLTEATADDQRKFIKAQLRGVYENIEEVAADIHERIVSNKLKDVLSVPLLLHMFTTICSNRECYQKIRQNEVSLAQIYGMFVDAKFTNHFADKVTEKNALFSQLQSEFKAFRMPNYLEAACVTCFGDNLLLKTANCVGFLQDIAETGDIIGLITMIVDDDNTPIFLHKTFAEYFAALFLMTNREQLSSKFLSKLFKAEHRNIRLLFDMCLSENHPAHQAVLALNLDKLKEIAEGNEDVIYWTDDGGRNVLHLASSYGTLRVPLKSLTSAEAQSLTKSGYSKPFLVKTFDGAPLHNIEKEDGNYEEMLKYLVHLATNQKQQAFAKDKIFGLNCIEYADASLSLHAIEALLRISKVKKKLQRFLHNYKNTETLVAYSIVLGYEDILSLFRSVPYFELLVGRNFYQSRDLNDLDAYNIFLLIIEFGRIDLLKNY